MGTGAAAAATASASYRNGAADAAWAIEQASALEAEASLRARAPATVKLFSKRQQRLSTWEELVDGMSHEEVVHRCATDVNFLTQFLMPDTFKFNWPPLLVAMWYLMIESLAALQDFTGIANLALGIPRGFAKTTLMKVFCFYCLAFSRHTFILVVGNSDPNAGNIIKDIEALLDSPQVRLYFGNYDAKCSKNTQDEKVFSFCGNECVLKAKGQRTSLRGINVGNRRPDVILMDDVQDEENAKSEVESESLLSWIVGTLLPTRSPEGAINLYVGNTYEHKGAILTKLAEDSEWVSLTLGAILKDGTSLWPELHPIITLLSAYRSAARLGKEGSWLAQYMNVMDIAKNQSFNPTLIRQIWDAMAYDWHQRLLAIDEGGEADARFIIIDPASTKEQADEHAVGLVYVLDDKVVMRSIIQKQLTPIQAIREGFKLAIAHNCFDIFIEDVAYQDTLLWWFNKAKQKLLLPPQLKELFSIRPIAPERRNKNSRILTAFGQFNSGEILVHPDAMVPIKNEGVAFDKLKTNNRDNALDVCHYAPIVWAKHKVSLMETAYKATFAMAAARQQQRLKQAYASQRGDSQEHGYAV